MRTRNGLRLGVSDSLTGASPLRAMCIWGMVLGAVVATACGGPIAPEPGPEVTPTVRLLVADTLNGAPLGELEGRTLSGTLHVVVEMHSPLPTVGFYLNGNTAPSIVTTTYPYSFEFDTTLLPNGDHTLLAATAARGGGARRVLAEAAFTVSNQLGNDPTDPPPGDSDPVGPPPTEDDPSDPTDPPPGDDDPSDPVDPPPGDEDPVDPVPGGLGERVGVVHAPFVEWRVEVGEVGGVSPWDVRAFASFSLRGGSEVFRVPWFYGGDGVFVLRFTGPLEGVYDVVSSSADVPALDGVSGVVRMEANPDGGAKGFLTSVGNAFAYSSGDGRTLVRTLYNVYQRHDQSRAPAGWETVAEVPVDARRPFEGLGERIEVMLDEVAGHGMQALFLMVAHNSTNFPSAYDSGYVAGRETPDATTFAILEEVLRRAHARGLFVHFWLWADTEAGASSETLPGGVNGWLDQRLNRYFVARLGAFPNWSMSLGYDLNEWVTPAEARTWAADLRSWSTLPRVLMARESQDGATHRDPFSLGTDKLDAYSLDQRPTEGFFEDARARFEAVAGALPVMYERRFLHTRDGVWDMRTTRRAMWQFSLAGGAGGVYGTLWGPGPDYPSPEQLVTLARFWEQRFAFPLQPQRSPVDGLVMADGVARHVVYVEDADRVTIALPDGVRDARVIAVNTRAAYAELDLGTLDAGTHTLTLPTRSDWALAIGDFDRR